MKPKIIIAALLLGFISFSCSNDSLIDPSDQDFANRQLKSASPHLKIAVVSDIHYMDPSLLPVDIAHNVPFQTYLAKDGKLLEFSDPIVKEVISALIGENPDMVLIPGDLTKDGEKISHQNLISILKELNDNNIKVFVTPGNHDINNPQSYSFKTNTLVPTVNPTDFATLYKDFGYKDALYRDPNSLTYISQPFDKVWILAIDGCKYDQNTDKPIVGGAIRPSTMTWIKEKMKMAQQQDITVLAMMHHGVMEHYVGQNSLDPGYIIDNPGTTAATLLEAGIKVIFTGHYHANDISEFTMDGQTLTDIETGSLVTPPSPYRILTLDDNFINVQSLEVSSINATLPGGMDFVTYSQWFLSQNLDNYFMYVLTYNFGVPPALTQVAAPMFRNAIMAHYAGDEKIGIAEKKNLEDLELVAPVFITDALASMWTDLGPKDNKTHIKIK